MIPSSLSLTGVPAVIFVLSVVLNTCSGSDLTLVYLHLSNVSIAFCYCTFHQVMGPSPPHYIGPLLPEQVWCVCLCWGLTCLAQGVWSLCVGMRLLGTVQYCKSPIFPSHPHHLCAIEYALRWCAVWLKEAGSLNTVLDAVALHCAFTLRGISSPWECKIWWLASGRVGLRPSCRHSSNLRVCGLRLRWWLLWTQGSRKTL